HYFSYDEREVKKKPSLNLKDLSESRITENQTYGFHSIQNQFGDSGHAMSYADANNVGKTLSLASNSQSINHTKTINSDSKITVNQTMTEVIEPIEAETLKSDLTSKESKIELVEKNLNLMPHQKLPVIESLPNECISCKISFHYPEQRESIDNCVTLEIEPENSSLK
ncbi:hypothetical protein HK096_001024, partial [Nowakowskiella sp. JEL0078]